MAIIFLTNVEMENAKPVGNCLYWFKFYGVLSRNQAIPAIFQIMLWCNSIDYKKPTLGKWNYTIGGLTLEHTNDMILY